MKNSKKLFILKSDATGGEKKATEEITKKLRKLNVDCLLIENKINRRQAYFKRIFQTIKSAFSFLKSYSKQKNYPIYTPCPIRAFTLVVFSAGKVRPYFNFQGSRYSPIWIELANGANPLKSLLALPLRLFVRFCEIATSYLSEIVFVPCSYTKKHLLRTLPFLNPKRIVIAPNCADSKIFRRVSKEDASSRTIKVLYVGRLDIEKGILLVLKALNELSEDFPFKLSIAHPNTNKKLLSKITDTPRKFKIKFYKQLNSRQLAKLYNESDFSILPSYKENLPLTLLESISCGTPMLATHIGGIKKVLIQIDQRLLIERPEVNCVKKTIIRYINLSSEEKASIQKKCSQVSKKYRWEKSAKIIRDEIFKI